MPWELCFPTCAGDHVPILPTFIASGSSSVGCPHISWSSDTSRLLKVGIFASLPLWAGVVGDTVGGVGHRLVAEDNWQHQARARRLVAIVGMLGCAACIVPAALTEMPTAVYCLMGAMFFLECTIGPSWAVPMDVGGKYSGTVSGMMNMAGNIGGALSPLVFGVLVQFGSWQAPFIVAASLLVIGSAVWAFWLDPDVSVVEPQETPSAVAVAGT